MEVLHVLAGLKTGGVESFIINLREALPLDIHFNFLLRQLDNDVKKLNYFESKGSRVYITSEWPKHPIKNYEETKNFLYNNKFDYVHIHCNALMYILPIKTALDVYPSSKVIVHSHSVRSQKKYMNVIHAFNKKWLSNQGIVQLACSDTAGKWMFSKNYIIVPNAINVDKYFMNNSDFDNRHQVSIVLVSVGRVEKEKNYSFMINVVERLLNRGYNVKYYIAGSGAQLEFLKRKIKSRSLENSIIFLGNVVDIPNLLKKAHIFVMPSLYEGFGISLLEAEAVGVPAVVSKAIPNEAILCKNVYSIELSIESWVKKIEELIKLPEKGFLKENHEIVKRSRYTLSSMSKTMMKVYGLS